LAEQLANSAASTLTAAIPDGVATSLTVANGTVFPATGNFRILVDSELMIVGARSGNTLSSLTRGAEGTTAVAHLSAAAVTHLLTKGGLDAYAVVQSIVDAKGDLIVASAADTVARVAVGTDGQVLTADAAQATGVKWAAGSSELGYVERTTDLNVTATTDATAQTFITLPAISFDGATAIYLEFFCYSGVTPTVAAQSILFTLWEDATDLGRIARVATASAAATQAPALARRKLTPAAGSRTYSVRVWAASATGPPQALAGPGGAGAGVPAYLRAIRV
jgi:hypothetical protein